MELQKAIHELHQQNQNPENGEEHGDRVPVEDVRARDEEILQDLKDEDPTTKKEGPLRRLSRKLTRPDSLDVESMRVKGMEHGPKVSGVAWFPELANFVLSYPSSSSAFFLFGKQM